MWFVPSSVHRLTVRLHGNCNWLPKKHDKRMQRSSTHAAGTYPVLAPRRTITNRSVAGTPPVQEGTGETCVLLRDDLE